MTIHASNWVWEQPVRNTDKLVLLYLADSANESGLSWPGRERIAKHCGITGKHRKQVVTNIFGRLEKQGLIKRYKRYDKAGDQTSNHTVVLFPGRKMDLDPVDLSLAYHPDTQTAIQTVQTKPKPPEPPPKPAGLDPLNSTVYQEPEGLVKDSRKRDAPTDRPVEIIVEQKPPEPEPKTDFKQSANNEFDYQLVLLWILNNFAREHRITVDQIAKAERELIENALQEYTDTATRPHRIRALAWVKRAMYMNAQTNERTRAISAARDRAAQSVCNLLDAQALSNNAKARQMRPKTTAEKLSDRSWTAGLDALLNDPDGWD